MSPPREPEDLTQRRAEHVPMRAPPVHTRINAVKFRQDAAVSAYITVHWIDDTEKSKDLGPWKSINQEETFNLVDEGVPDGSMVNFSSYVSAVGTYTDNHWFVCDSTAREGADFRQTGTAFKGWFDLEGLYPTVGRA